MEDTEMLSPSPPPPTFKSPRRVTTFSSLGRSRRGSGSNSVSSTEISQLQPEDVLICPSESLNYSDGAIALSTSISPCGSDSSTESTARVNPFENDLLSGLQRSFCSPTIMVINDTPPQRSWTIEHLARLFPKDIENSPSTHQNAFPVDENMEAQAQADIDKYFSRDSIVPTPSPLKARDNNIPPELISPKTEDSVDVTVPRRKLVLSFGENEPIDNDPHVPVSPISVPLDPFLNNHMMSTPPPSNSALTARLVITAPELNAELVRCAVTPEAKGVAPSIFTTDTPGVSPIIDEPAQHRNTTGGVSKKRVSSSSFNDSSFMECSPPPAKVSRLNLTDNDNIDNDEDDSNVS